MLAQFQQFDTPLLNTSLRGRLEASRLVWGFVALGTVIRLVGYLLNFPLWIDECMLAENFLDRGFLDLCWPLRNQQVAPIGFLWIELACVRVFGFSEWSLRLFPLICGIGSLFMFRHLASRLLAGVPLVLAVACLAVAKAPVGLCANAKPYAGDLFMAIGLVALAVEWLRRPDETRWLWYLAAALPVAFALSFPAVFVAGAMSLGLLVPVWQKGESRIWRAFAIYHVSIAVAFAGLVWIASLGQSPDTQTMMRDYWAQQDGFPPGEIWPLIHWFLVSHLGDKIFAIPYGAENGGGLVGFVACIAAAMTMFRRGQRPVMAMLLATFGLSFLAAALRLYPYGGHNRLAQFLVPWLAISIGIGTAEGLVLLRNPNFRRGLLFLLLGSLTLFGAGVCGRDVLYPYHYVHDEHHREFARRFWFEEPGTTTICSLTDLKVKFCKLGWYGYYRCNQRIYSARHRLRQSLEKPEFGPLVQPLRLVVFRPPYRVLDPKALTECLKRFEPFYELIGRESYEPCLADIGIDKYGGYDVYRFSPRQPIVTLANPAIIGKIEAIADGQPLSQTPAGDVGKWGAPD